MDKQILKTPKEATERAEYELEQEERQIICKDNGNGMSVSSPMHQPTPYKNWEGYTIEQLVDLYTASLAKGKPNMALVSPQQVQHVCHCTDKHTKSVALYMLCDHVERTITYCGCRSLVEILFEMQFLPSSGKSPNEAIHFAMLKYLHISKMIYQKSLDGFAEVANETNRGAKRLDGKVLNNVYLLYQTIVNHTTDSMTKMVPPKQ